MDYETARHLADTWGLLGLVLLFVGIVAFVFRPGTKQKYEHDAQIPLKED